VTKKIPHSKSKWREYLYRSLFTCILLAIGLYIYSLYIPLHAPQLLPLPPAHPSSDGSYPELLIRYDSANPGGTPFAVSFTRNSPSLTHDSPVNQFEVNLSTGRFVLRQTDLFEAGAIPISLTRTYTSFEVKARSFGIATGQPYDLFPVGSRSPYTFIDLELEDGSSIHFERISKGEGWTDAIYEHRTTSSKEFLGARIRWHVDEWDLSLPDGRTFVFPEAYSSRTFAQMGIRELRSASGQRINVSRSYNGNIKSVASPSGHRIDFTYDDSARIIEGHDDLGGDRRYSYDSDGRLDSVSDAISTLYQFAYVRNLMTRIMDGGGKEILGILYDGGRVTKLRLASGDSYDFEYDVDSSNHVIHTRVSSAGGKTSEFDFR
jgi:YD repeat-containing protein